MNNDIKEIIEDLKNEDNYIEDYGFRYKRIALYDVWYLLDYITNLQEENERLNNIIEEKKIPEKLDYIHPDISCSYNESELLLRIEANKDKINSIIDYLKSKGEKQ